MRREGSWARRAYGAVVRGYGLDARLTPEVSRSPIAITTSIPAMSAPILRSEVAGAFQMLGIGVGVATGSQTFRSEAIKVDPKYAGSYSGRAIAYEQLGQQEQADRDRAKARELSGLGPNR